MKAGVGGLFFLGILLPSALLACAPPEIWALRSAHRVIAGEILSVNRTAEGERARLLLEVKVDEVLVGQPMEDELVRVEMELEGKAETPSYGRGKQYVLYLRKSRPGSPQQDAPVRWSVKYGTRSIRPDTEKLRKLLGPDGSGRDRAHSARPEDVDVRERSPLDRRLHSVIVPEIDIACANIRDVVAYLGSMSSEIERSVASPPEAGVNVCLNARSFAEGELSSVNLYLEGASLLQLVDIVAGVTGERHEIDNWVVISRKGFGEPKPAVSTGAGGSDSPFYRTLQTTLVPGVDFRQTKIGDVAEFLAESSGSRITWTPGPGGAAEAVTVTLAGEHASVLSILSVLTVLHPLEVVIGETSVAIRPAARSPRE